MSTPTPEPLNPDFEAAYKAGLASGLARKKSEPFASCVSFDQDHQTYFIRLLTGIGLEIPVAVISELNGARPEQLADVDLFGEGEGIHWESLDVDVSVGTIINRAFGGTVRSMSARKAASTTSANRATAARENGRKGGRPRKTSAG